MTSPEGRMDCFCRLCHPTREHLARPFAVNGWAVATDGAMLTALAGIAADVATDDRPGDAAKRVQDVCGWLAVSPSGREVSLVALRAFAGEAMWTAPCEECEGTGKIRKCPECDGEGRLECECEHGDTVTHDCDECNGSGHIERDTPGIDFVDCAECRGTGQTREFTGYAVPVRIEGVIVDRRRLARLLACAPDGETVRIAALDGATRFALWGAGWHACLMAVRSEEPTMVFEPGGAA